MDLSLDFLTEVLAAEEPPCLSLYQPTHRSYPDNQQDPIRFRNLVRKLEQSLEQKYDSAKVKELLRPFRELAEDSEFWTHTLDGLAVLGTRDFFRAYRLQRPMPELAIAADTFHLKPLLRIVQSADRFHVVGLDRQRVRLFEGNRDALDEVELAADFPSTIEAVPGPELRDAHKETSKGAAGTTIRGGGLGSKSEIPDRDAERFFRAVDRAILEQYSRPSRRRLVLIALPENQSLFRRISNNPYLLAQGIDQDPDSIAPDQLRKRVWSVVEPEYLARLAGFVEMFRVAEARELGLGDLAQVANAAAGGRVATLLVEAERRIPGRLDPETGRIDFDDLANPEVDDLLDDLAELVIKQGGEVVIVPQERMPTQSGVAAIYRF